MFLLTTTLVLSLLGLRVLADAVSCNDTALGITAIEAGFANASIVPDLLPSFNASAVMNVAFPVAGLISPGQNLSTQQVATAPNVTITPANSSVPATGNYTLMMVDAGAAGTNESSGQVLHWLANFATLQNDSSPCPSLNVSTNGGLVVTNFVSPQPPAGTGLHRYVILLFLQPPSFSPPANFSSPNIGIDLKFNFTDYVSSSNFTQPIAGMFFEVQSPTNVTANTTAPLSSGSAVATPSSTSPVSSSLANVTTPLSSAVATSSPTSPVSSSLANATTPLSSAVAMSMSMSSPTSSVSSSLANVTTPLPSAVVTSNTTSSASSTSTAVRRRRLLGRVTVQR